MADCINALREWTGKARATIVFDSTVDEFTNDGLFDKVKGKSDIAVIGFTTDGDVFGGFYSVAVTKQDKEIFDPNLFIFSFESHGRCKTPQRFVLKEGLKNACVEFFKDDSSYGFVWFSVFCSAGFWLGNEKSKSYCKNLSDGFEGIEDTTLTGPNGDWFIDPYHHCTHLVAVRLSN